MHIEMPREVERIFAKQPIDPKGGLKPQLGPPRPLGYFGFPMVNSSRPPLPPNMPYCQPLNYTKYVKNSDLDVHVKVLKAAIRANGKIEYAKIVNMFSFTFRDIVFDWCNNYTGDYPNCTFAKLQLTFCKQFRTVQNDEQVYL
jgi:hypothetical protein